MPKFYNEEIKNEILNNLISDIELGLGLEKNIPPRTINRIKSMFNKSLEKAGIFNNVTLEDMKDYIAYILWSRDDIRGELIELGYEDSEENIDIVINSGLLKDLGGCLDEQWNQIHFAIKETLGEVEKDL